MMLNGRRFVTNLRFLMMIWASARLASNNVSSNKQVGDSEHKDDELDLDVIAAPLDLSAELENELARGMEEGDAERSPGIVVGRRAAAADLAQVPPRLAGDHVVERWGVQGAFCFSVVAHRGQEPHNVSVAWNARVLLSHPSHPSRNGAGITLKNGSLPAGIIMIKRWLIVGLSFWVRSMMDELNLHFYSRAAQMRDSPEPEQVDACVASGWLSETDCHGA